MTRRRILIVLVAMGTLFVGALILSHQRWRSKPVTSISGQRYDVISDLRTVDGRHYAVSIVAPKSMSTDTLEVAARDLVATVESRSPGLEHLRTFSVEARERHGLGPFSTIHAYGCILETHKGEWERAGPVATREHMAAFGWLTNSPF